MSSLVARTVATLTRRIHPPGTERVVRIIHPPGGRSVVETRVRSKDGLWFHVRSESFIEWRLLFFGTYEPGISHVIRTVLKSGDDAIDVGANIGTHALLMAQQVGSGRVIACEPDDVLFQKMASNARLNAIEPHSREEGCA
jgi:hypothetical protein